VNVIINDEAHTLVPPLTLADLLTQLCCQQAGTALAVNQQIVSRDRWSTYPLQEGDELVIFQAIAGG